MRSVGLQGHAAVVAVLVDVSEALHRPAGVLAHLAVVPAEPHEAADAEGELEPADGALDRYVTLGIDG